MARSPVSMPIIRGLCFRVAFRHAAPVDPMDLYRVLQVDPEAEFDVIRAAHRVLAARNHPDVGGSGEVMARINGAWAVLSDPAARAAYDRQRRLRDGSDRWDAYGRAARPPAQATGTILDFGRYAGWSIPEVAQADPDFLEWLARTPNGRRYQDEIDQVLRGRPADPIGAVAMGRSQQVARGH
jgi:curved DNA-binding protein CbpA